MQEIKQVPAVLKPTKKLFEKPECKNKNKNLLKWKWKSK